jgi:DNA-3-methyladenine glycosylase I
MPGLGRGLVRGADGLVRCFWGDSDDLYRRYHDEEWGMPVADDRTLFEKLCLEGFQSGLSWITILRKRENFRRAFRGFAPEAVARFDRGKIESTVNNARRALELRREFGSLARYIWGWEPAAASRPRMLTRRALLGMSTTEQSIALSRDLKKRGWTFVGPTTVYAFMQAMGLVNDHIEGCAARPRVQAARDAFARPA